ncbi:MAG: hypothetical protein H7837_11210 [Magnetococcus sp. MYC-9]
MKKIPFVPAMLATALLFTGCAATPPPSISRSFDDVSSETEMQGKHSNLTQTKTMSLNGLSATLWPADVCYGKLSHTPASGICLAPRGRDSFYRVRTMGQNVTVADVVATRNAVETMVHTAERYMEAKLALVNFDLLQLSKEKATDDKESERQTIRAKLAEAVAKRDTEYTTQITAVQRAIAKPGIIVFQWDAQAEVTAGGSAGGLLGVGYDDSGKRTGFGIAGGIRASRLFLGKEITNEDLWSHIPDKIENKIHTGVPTTIVQAKYLASFSEMERMTALHTELSATFEQLATLTNNPALLKTAKLELSFAMSRMYRVSNSSLLGGGSVAEYPVRWDRSFDSMADCVGRKDRKLAPSCWQTVYKIDTQLKDLRNIMHEKPQDVK